MNPESGWIFKKIELRGTLERTGKKSIKIRPDAPYPLLI